MGIIDQLFRRPKPVTAKDLKVSLLGLKRENRKKQLELRKLGARRAKVIDRARQLRKEGNQIELDLLWEEVRQLKVDTHFLKREAKIVSLETIALTRYSKAMERLERSNDGTRIQQLLNRVRTSGLEEKLRGQEVDEHAYLDELTATLDEIGVEIDSYETEDDDPEKASFLEALDAINTAEDAGRLDEAIEKQEILTKKLEDEGPAELDKETV
jgi:hypothetical protein